MIYIFDSSSLIHLFHNYYPGRFPSLWERFDESVGKGEIKSVKEALHELSSRKDRLSLWSKDHRHLFDEPTTEEGRIVTRIFSIPHFQQLISFQARLTDKHVADPFIIAKAKAIDGIVITEELLKPNAARIPNVCEHFQVKWRNFEGFMEEQNWVF